MIYEQISLPIICAVPKINIKYALGMFPEEYQPTGRRKCRNKRRLQYSSGYFQGPKIRLNSVTSQ